MELSQPYKKIARNWFSKLESSKEISLFKGFSHPCSDAMANTIVKSETAYG